jgi:hypothetical protein
MAGDDIGKHAMQSQGPSERDVDTGLGSGAQVCKRARRDYNSRLAVGL